MNKLNIALLQIAPCETLEENLEKGMEACRKAKSLGADIALFPEMWSNGYRLYDRPVELWKAEAISTKDCFVEAFRGLADELSNQYFGDFITISYCQRCIFEVYYIHKIKQ